MFKESRDYVLGEHALKQELMKNHVIYTVLVKWYCVGIVG